jgi:hypothetical protein
VRGGFLLDYPICRHLSDYRDQFAAAESAYAAVLALLDRAERAGDVADVREALAPRLATWLEAVSGLRALLVDLVREGRVVVPRNKHALPRCRICRCSLRRLEYPEWEFAEDGSVSYRELLVAAAAEPAGASC